jgi:hypothetical protein
MNSSFAHTHALQRIKGARDDVLHWKNSKEELEAMYVNHKAYSPGHKGCCLMYVVVIKALDEELTKALELQKQVRRGKI